MHYNTHARTRARTHTHTHAQLLYCPLHFVSRFTQVSWYQKGKINLDFNEARDSEWQWHQLGHVQICTSPRQITMPAPNHSDFTGRMPFLLPNQQRQSTEGILCIMPLCRSNYINHSCIIFVMHILNIIKFANLYVKRTNFFLVRASIDFQISILTRQCSK